MYRRSPCKYLDLTPQAPRLLIAILTTLLFSPTLQAKMATISGIVFTVASDRVQTVWPNARVTLKSLDTRNETTTVSSDLGT
jgi:hypothetical protein